MSSVEFDFTRVCWLVCYFRIIIIDYFEDRISLRNLNLFCYREPPAYLLDLYFNDHQTDNEAGGQNALGLV